MSVASDEALNGRGGEAVRGYLLDAMKEGSMPLPTS